MSDQAQTLTLTVHFPRADPGPAHTTRMLALLKFLQEHDGEVTEVWVTPMSRARADEVLLEQDAIRARWSAQADGGGFRG